jgi:hypothetical protein
MSQRIRRLTAQQYATEFNRPLSLVKSWMQPSRNVLMMFDQSDIDRSSPRNPLIICCPPDALGRNERPKKIFRKSVHKAGGALPMVVMPSEGSASFGVAHPPSQNVLGDVPFDMVGREGMTQALQVNGLQAQR